MKENERPLPLFLNLFTCPPPCGWPGTDFSSSDHKPIYARFSLGLWPGASGAPGLALPGLLGGSDVRPTSPTGSLPTGSPTGSPAGPEPPGVGRVRATLTFKNLRARRLAPPFDHRRLSFHTARVGDSPSVFFLARPKGLLESAHAAVHNPNAAAAAVATEPPNSPKRGFLVRNPLRGRRSRREKGSETGADHVHTFDLGRGAEPQTMAAPTSQASGQPGGRRFRWLDEVTLSLLTADPWRPVHGIAGGSGPVHGGRLVLLVVDKATQDPSPAPEAATSVAARKAGEQKPEGVVLGTVSLGVDDLIASALGIDRRRKRGRRRSGLARHRGSVAFEEDVVDAGAECGALAGEVEVTLEF